MSGMKHWELKINRINGQLNMQSEKKKTSFTAREDIFLNIPYRIRVSLIWVASDFILFKAPKYSNHFDQTKM
jgi:predicted transcriptional regulator